MTEIIAEYITRIEIMRLWSERPEHIVWNLKPDVNILSGVNGVGKSTILNKLAGRLKLPLRTGDPAGMWADNEADTAVRISCQPQEATCVRFDVIRNFDRPFMQQTDPATHLPDIRITTELDWQLYLLQRRYLDYQVNLGNRMIETLTAGGPDAAAKAAALAQRKTDFQDMVDDLFGETGKKIDRKSNEIVLLQLGQPLSPYLLSSGEKQMLIILLTVLTEDGDPYVLLMDEPEISLHVEWQQRLISLIRKLNPRVQIILTTHSPALIMNGWMDDVTDVADITLPH